MSQQTSPIISQIETWVQDIPGWSPIDQLYTLFNLVYLTADLKGDIVEVGSWCGRSTLVLGMAAQLIGKTKVFCIDLFPEKNDWYQKEDGSYYFQVKIDQEIYGGYQEQTVWADTFARDIAPLYTNHQGILEIFTQTIENNGLQEIVNPHRGTSSLFSKFMAEDFQCKLIFLDGDHSYEAVCQDIKTIEPYLVSGGWICFDDAFSYYPGVDQAIQDLIISNPHYDLCQQMTRKFFVARKK